MHCRYATTCINHYQYSHVISSLARINFNVQIADTQLSKFLVSFLDEISDRWHAAVEQQKEDEAVKSGSAVFYDYRSRVGNATAASRARRLNYSELLSAANSALSMTGTAPLLDDTRSERGVSIAGAEMDTDLREFERFVLDPVRAADAVLTRMAAAAADEGASVLQNTTEDSTDQAESVEPNGKRKVSPHQFDAHSLQRSLAAVEKLVSCSISQSDKLHDPRSELSSLVHLLSGQRFQLLRDLLSSSELFQSFVHCSPRFQLSLAAQFQLETLRLGNSLNSLGKSPIPTSTHTSDSHPLAESALVSDKLDLVLACVQHIRGIGQMVEEELLPEFPEHPVLQRVLCAAKRIASCATLESSFAGFCANVECLLDLLERHLFTNLPLRFQNLLMQRHVGALLEFLVERFYKEEIYSRNFVHLFERYRFEAFTLQTYQTYWIPLYELIVRRETAASLPDLRTLAETLCEFLDNSTLGDFETRLDIVSSFDGLVRATVASPALEQNASRMHDLLSNIRSYYSSVFYSRLYNRSATDYLAPLRKRFREFLEVLSWVKRADMAHARAGAGVAPQFLLWRRVRDKYAVSRKQTLSFLKQLKQLLSLPVRQLLQQYRPSPQPGSPLPADNSDSSRQAPTAALTQSIVDSIQHSITSLRVSQDIQPSSAATSPADKFLPKALALGERLVRHLHAKQSRRSVQQIGALENQLVEAYFKPLLQSHTSYLEEQRALLKPEASAPDAKELKRQLKFLGHHKQTLFAELSAVLIRSGLSWKRGRALAGGVADSAAEDARQRLVRSRARRLLASRLVPRAGAGDEERRVCETLANARHELLFMYNLVQQSLACAARQPAESSPTLLLNAAQTERAAGFIEDLVHSVYELHSGNVHATRTLAALEELADRLLSPQPTTERSRLLLQQQDVLSECLHLALEWQRIVNTLLEANAASGSSNTTDSEAQPPCNSSPFSLLADAVDPSRMARERVYLKRVSTQLDEWLTKALSLAHSESAEISRSQQSLLQSSLELCRAILEGDSAFASGSCAATTNANLPMFDSARSLCIQLEAHLHAFASTDAVGDVDLSRTPEHSASAPERCFSTATSLAAPLLRAIQRLYECVLSTSRAAANANPVTADTEADKRRNASPFHKCTQLDAAFQALAPTALLSLLNASQVATRVAIGQQEVRSASCAATGSAIGAQESRASAVKPADSAAERSLLQLYVLVARAIVSERLRVTERAGAFAFSIMQHFHQLLVHGFNIPRLEEEAQAESGSGETIEKAGGFGLSSEDQGLRFQLRLRAEEDVINVKESH